MSSAGVVAARVCILLEGNAPMARHWSDFLHIYLTPLFRSLQLQLPGLTEVCLVVFYTRSPYSLCRLERSDWTSDWKEVDSLLKTAHISGGGNIESCLPEALSEALCLFQTPSALKAATNIVQHCLLFSLTEAHNMAVGWPFPLPTGVDNQGTGTASFSIGMAEAFRQQGISLSVFSSYPSGISNASWPALLSKLFANAEQGRPAKPKTDEEQREQQQQRVRLRDDCSMGLQPGHFVMLSKQWGQVVKVLQTQRNKRKAAQAFEDAPLNGYQGKHAAAFASPQHQSTAPGKAAPTAVQPASTSQAPPQTSATPPLLSVQAKTQALTAGQSGALPNSEALVDLTGPTAGVQPEKPETVDLTEEESPQILPSQPHAAATRPQLQPGSHNPLQPRPPQAASLPQANHSPSPRQQQHQPEGQQRQQSPSPAGAAAAGLTIQQQQQLLLQQQKQFHQAQLRQRQQQQRPTSAPAPAAIQHPQQQPQHQQQQQLQQQSHSTSHVPQSLYQPQQQQQLRWQEGQAGAVQLQGRSQTETALQANRPSSAPVPQAAPSISQAQQQLLQQQQQLRLQQQQQQAHGQVQHAGQIQPGQSQTLQQIQNMQAQLKQKQAYVQGPGQSSAAALPHSSLSQQQAQGRLEQAALPVNFSQGPMHQGQALHQGQGQPLTALPQARSGQSPAAMSPLKQVPAMSHAQSMPGVMSPAASSSGSAKASPLASGPAPLCVWEGSIEAAAIVLKKAENQHMMTCKLLAKPGGWPPGLEHGWSKVLVVTKTIFSADLTKLLGPEAFKHAPRLMVQMITSSDKGKSFVQDLASKKAMGIIQLPIAGKFLGVLVTTPTTAPQHRLLALVLNLPQQQNQRTVPAQS